MLSNSVSAPARPLLHLFGLDHMKLLYHHNGQEERITDSKPCRVVKEILRNA